MKLRTVGDLLYHFPARYEAAGATGTIAGIAAGAEVTLYGTIRKPDIRKTWKSRRPIAEAWLEDASGKIKLMWFSQPYIAKTLADGMVVKVSGKVTHSTGSKSSPQASSGQAGRYIANPEIDRTPTVNPEEIHANLFVGGLTSEMAEPDLFPVYPESEGISSLWFHHNIDKVFKSGVLDTLVDPIPEEILKRYNLPTLATAIIWMHRPKRLADSAAARKRFAFEEVFTLQLLMQQRRRVAAPQRALPVQVDRAKLADFVASFPFPPTKAQTRAIDAIATDFAAGHPMLRLLEGDVGSGKTAVAAASAYMVATSRPPNSKAGTLQVAYMCPTEILAKQHFATFASYFKDHPIPIGLITGSECRKFPSRVRYEDSAKVAKSQFKKWVANGEIPIVIGTHALVQDSLQFKHLAYAIVDEQHRFGTAHRQKLITKDDTVPHLLSMTATPIPRTLALTIYGDLDISLLDEMPAGRKPIITEILGPEKRGEAYKRMREELAKGRQGYVICPRIDEPDPEKQFAIQAKSVKAEAERLSKDVFPDYDIAILHSKMTPSEKEATMEAFENNEVQILVATSVVEVGVNVPNATVILIEGAERFGLAQLHQLRGRVIRSNHQAYCFALPETFGQATKDRLKALTTAKNGFDLAEYDLALRGSGELSGGHQWGVSDIAMEALKNIKLVEAARSEARALINLDPDLRSLPALAARVAHAGDAMHLE
jgi:ATP-dependent DNA helicase RecG